MKIFAVLAVAVAVVVAILSLDGPEAVSAETETSQAPQLRVGHRGAFARLEHDPDRGAMVLVQSFVAVEAADTPKGAVVPMTEDCPEDGWRHYRSDGERRLYFPFGLMVDADGELHATPPVLLPACEKL